MTEPSPAPPPASEQRAAAPRSLRDALRIVQAQRDPKVEGARAEAYAQYGDDAERELAAFASGSHPMQRATTPAKVEETKRMAAASFARLPAKHSLP